MKEEIVVPTISKEGKPFVGKKYSVTIEDLAEGYKHKYKSYWWIVRRSDKSFVCKAKNKFHAEQIIKNCSCQHLWRVESCLESEAVLKKREEKNRGQYQGTHKVLDIQQRYKKEELSFDRKRLSEQNKVINDIDRAKRTQHVKTVIGVEHLRQNIKDRAKNGLETYYDREILSAIDVETAKKDLIKELMI